MAALLKDALREIKKSFGRFMSIFLIIALGCGFYTGLKATKPDMIYTASQYFESNNLMDLRLRSNIGVKSADIAAVRAADNVKGVCAGYSKDLYYTYGNQTVVLKAMSLNSSSVTGSKNDLNCPELVEGRMPESKNECVVEKKMTSPDTFEIGTSITLESPSESEELSDTLAYDTYEIVGIVVSPMYIGIERDSTSIGSGSVNSNIYIPEESFVCDYYTDLYVTLDGVEDLDPFSQEYEDEVERLGADAAEAFEKSVSERYDKMIADAQDDIASAEESISTTEQILDCTDDELTQLYEATLKSVDDITEQYSSMDESSGIRRSLVRARLVQTKQKLQQLEALIGDTDGSVKADYEQQLEDWQLQLNDAKQELSSVTELKTYTENRFSSNDYSSYSSDADRIDALSKVFPAFFILIAALVCVTAMTRMIEEQRTIIGSYKALGYSSFRILLKYLIYAFVPASFGSCLGSVIGMQIFPQLIIKTYRMMYNLPYALTPFRLSYMLAALVAAVVVTSLAVAFTCSKELKAQPSEIMRPKPPKSGKRVIFERFPKLWNRLSFLMKVTLRNLLRYKKRFIMTLVGVSGCTALIITGFGIKYSVSSIVDMQYGGIFKYSAMAAYNTDEDDPQNALEESDSIESFISVTYQNVDASANGATYQATLIASSSDMSEYIDMHTPDGDTLSLANDGVIITQKLADFCSVSVGEKIEFTDSEGDVFTAEVSGIMENYALHFVFMSASEYENVFGITPSENLGIFNTSSSADEDKLKTELISDNRILGVSFKDDSTSGFVSSIESMDTIVLLLIVCAAFLALTVLYNLADINISERKRELATIKVLGFYDIETSEYIYRENIISTLIGVVVGLGLGRILHKLVVMTVEVEQVMFNDTLVWWAYLLGALLTLAFALLVNATLHFKLKKIDMAQSLKSVE